MLKQEQIMEMHNGLFHCPFDEALGLMPELRGILLDCPIKGEFSFATRGPRYEGWVVDVKVHMLMPGQWPCIPNWHYDFVPRDENGKQVMSRRDPDNKMYLWVSGEPTTEFLNSDGEPYSIPAEVWKEFNQYDLHRGTMSKEHTWRVFIRVSPESLCPVAPPNKWIRRHSQVYLDAENFKW